ncbi:MAG: NUDIX hydrolase [Clostridium sp.]
MIGLLIREKTISSEYIYKGKILNLRRDLVRINDGKTSYREVIEHNGAVGILCVDECGEVTMVKQYRKAVEDAVLEIPAGKIDGREQPYACAVREMEEETGLIPKELIFLGEFYLAAGYSGEKMYLYLCKNFTRGLQKLDEGENLEVLKFKYEKLVSMVENEEITDAKTALAILLAKKYI